MSYESGDFDRVVRFDNRLLGSVSHAPHIDTGSTPTGAAGRPQLSLVPDSFDVAPEAEEDQWQERALCAQTDPEAFFPERVVPPERPSASARGAKFVTRAWNTRSRMMSASVSGAVCRSVSAGASSAASSRRTAR